MIWLDLAAEGVASHGPHVPRGDNAIDRLLAALLSLKALEAMPIAQPNRVARTMEAAQPLSELIAGVGERDVMSRITINTGRIEGGTSANLVPARANAQLDIRLPLGTRVAVAENEIIRLLGAHPRVRHTVVRRYEPTWTSPAHPIVAACVDAAGAVLQRPVAVNMRVAASDARLWRRAGIPTVVCGLTPHNLGAPDEYLDVAELHQLAAIHALTAAQFLEQVPGARTEPRARPSDGGRRRAQPPGEQPERNRHVDQIPGDAVKERRPVGPVRSKISPDIRPPCRSASP